MVKNEINIWTELAQKRTFRTIKYTAEHLTSGWYSDALVRLAGPQISRFSPIRLHPKQTEGCMCYEEV